MGSNRHLYPDVRRQEAPLTRAVLLASVLLASVLLTSVLLAVPAGAARAQPGPKIPPPHGMVNDFAGVVPADQAARIERLALYVRARSGGEIAVVTLPDLAGRDVTEVALRIGREWKVGANAPIGAAARNTGIAILLAMPRPAPESRESRGRPGAGPPGPPSDRPCRPGRRDEGGRGGPGGPPAPPGGGTTRMT